MFCFTRAPSLIPVEWFIDVTVLKSNLLYVTVMGKIIRKRATIGLFSCFVTFRELNIFKVNWTDLRMRRINRIGRLV